MAEKKRTFESDIQVAPKVKLARRLQVEESEAAEQEVSPLVLPAGRGRVVSVSQREVVLRLIEWLKQGL